MNSAQEVLSATADTILETSIKVEVELLNLTWWERIAIKCRLKRAKKVFFVRPATPGTMIRISKLLLHIPHDLYKDTDMFINANYQAYANYGEIIAEVIAIAIKNSRNEPTRHEIDFILDNFTGKELMSVATVVLKQLDVMNFMSTIISMRGVSLLKTEELIASGQ